MINSIASVFGYYEIVAYRFCMMCNDAFANGHIDGEKRKLQSATRNSRRPKVDLVVV